MRAWPTPTAMTRFDKLAGAQSSFWSHADRALPAVVEWLASTLSSPPASTQALVSPSSAGRDVSEVEQLGALKVLQVLLAPSKLCVAVHT